MNQLAFSPDGRLLASAGLQDSTVVVWSVPSWKVEKVIGGFQGLTKGEYFEATAVAFSPDSRTLAVVANGSVSSHLLVLFSTSRWLKIRQASISSSSVWTDAYSPDGKYIATASDDGTAKVWDARTVANVAVLKGHTGFVADAAFSPDSQWLVTSGVDDTVRLWSAGDWTQDAVLVGHSPRACFRQYLLRMGSPIVSAGFDGQIRVHLCEVCGSGSQLLAVAARHEIRTLTTAERTAYFHQ